MVVRIKHKCNVRIATDTDMKNILFGPDDTLAEVVIDTFTKHTSGNITMLTTDTETLSFGDIDAVKGIYLYVDNDVKLTINGGTPIQMRQNTGTGTRAKFFLEADITSILVDNDTSGETVTGVYCVWGDTT